MTDRRLTLSIFGLALLLLLGLMSLGLTAISRPANATPYPTYTALPASALEATVNARLTAVAFGADQYRTATAIVQAAIGDAVTATAAAQRTLDAEIVVQLAADLTGTAIPAQTSTALARQALAGTAGALLATDQALLAGQTATSAAITATVEAVGHGASGTEIAHMSTSAAASTLTALREAALDDADLLSPANAARLSQLGETRLPGPVALVAVSADGRLIASASGDTVLLAALPEAKPIARLQHIPQVTDLAFSPDSRLLATASTDGEIRLWNAADGALIAILPGHTGEIFDVAFSPDSRLLASAGVDAARLWETETGHMLAVLPSGWTWGVTFSPGGRYVITAGGDGLLAYWGVPLHPTATPTPSPTPSVTLTPTASRTLPPG